MIKLMHKRYRVLCDHVVDLQASKAALFSSGHKVEKIDIEIAVTGKATASDVCRYAEERFKNLNNLRVLSVELLGCVDVVDLKLER